MLLFKKYKIMMRRAYSTPVCRVCVTVRGSIEVRARAKQRERVASSPLALSVRGGQSGRGDGTRWRCAVACRV